MELASGTMCGFSLLFLCFLCSQNFLQRSLITFRKKIMYPSSLTTPKSQGSLDGRNSMNTGGEEISQGGQHRVGSVCDKLVPDLSEPWMSTLAAWTSQRALSSIQVQRRETCPFGKVRDFLGRCTGCVANGPRCQPPAFIPHSSQGRVSHWPSLCSPTLPKWPPTTEPSKWPWMDPGSPDVSARSAESPG